MSAPAHHNRHTHAAWVLVWLAVLAAGLALLTGCSHMMDSGFAGGSVQPRPAGLNNSLMTPASIASPITPTPPQDAPTQTIRLAPGEELWVIARPEQPSTLTPPPGGLYRLAPGEDTQPVETRLSPLPLESTRIDARIDGPIASVKYGQSFSNPYATRIEAVYVFPLPGDAAVTGFVMSIGERRIHGIVRPLEEATKLYQQAKSQGLQASLLTQETMDLFTQRVANIEPGKSIGVELTYFQTLSPDDGTYAFTLPLTAPPRYDPVGGATQASGYTSRSPRFDLSIQLRSGTAIRDLASPTHAISVTSPNPLERRITLSDHAQATPTDRDFVLRYKLDEAPDGAQLWTHRDERTGRSYFAVSVCPPASGHADAPIDLVLLLDASGSMQGRPLEQLQHAARAAVEHLGPKDTLQIVAFGDRTSALFETPASATFAIRQEARGFIDGLKTMGGTELLPALRQAMSQPRRPGTRRVVALLSDALVSHDAPILETLREQREDTRFFAFGIGSSPNHALLSAMALTGQGAAAALSPADEPALASQMMARFFERARGTMLTDARLQTDGSVGITTYPQPLPTLMPGRPVLITGSVGSGASLPRRFEVVAREGGIERVFAVDLDDAQPCPALPTVVARQELHAMQQQLAQARSVEEHGTLLEQLLTLSQQSRLVTPYTAFVSIDATRRTDGEFGSTVDVPLTTPR